MKPLLKALLPSLWLALFVGVCLSRSSVGPSATPLLCWLAATGMAYVGLTSPGQLWALLARYRLLFGALAALSLCIVAAEALAWPVAPGWLARLPPQAALLWCVPPLALFLLNQQRLQAVMVVFGAVCVWHLVAMPIEAVYGLKLGWHPLALLPRVAGPLNFQASGLASQAYFFTGLFLAMFYMVSGPLHAGRVFKKLRLSGPVLVGLTALWLVPVAAVQSRSALAGALLACLLTLAAQLRDRRFLRMLWPVVVVALLAGLGFYWFLFSANKTGLDLRLPYLQHYFLAALQWPCVLTGHGFLLADASMLLPGLTPVGHSHNDLVQILYSWGLPALLAYLAFWAGLLRLVSAGFVKKGEYWPVYALVAVLPGMVTDLGFQLFEKATFLVFLTALCLAFDLQPAKAPPPATPP